MTDAITLSSKNSCEVNSKSSLRTLKWMWIARPEYQPGNTVTNVAAPSSPVTW